MFKKILSLILCILMIGSMCAVMCSCSSESASNEFPVTIGDTTIKSAPKNVVVLSDNFADIISLIGYDVKLVGKSAETDQEFLSVVPSMGTKEKPSIDAMVAAQTDLVIADTTLSDESKKQIEEKNITLLQLTNATTTDELKTLYINLGTALGGKTTGATKGENAYNDLFNTLDTLKSTVKNSIILTCCYLYLNDAGQLCTFTNDTLEKTIFEYNAALNIFKDQAEEVIDTETLRLSTPSYIFVSSELEKQALENDEELQNLSALRNDNVIIIPKKNFERQGQTYEDTVYEMLDIMFVKDRATSDEETTTETISFETTQSEVQISDDSNDDSFEDDEADIVGGYMQ